MIGFIFLAILVAVVVVIAFLIKTYNGLRRGSELVKRASSDMQGELRKRATLVNQLIDVCKGFGEHEKLTQITVAGATSSVAESASLARSTNTVIERVTAFAANFPELKADQTYVKLMGQIQGIENVLQEKREIYNRCVQEYNTDRASFPTVFFSEKWGYPEAPYFKTDETGLDDIAEFKTDDGEMLRAQMTKLGASAGDAGRKLAAQTTRAVGQLRDRATQGSLLNHVKAPASAADSNVVSLREVPPEPDVSDPKKIRRRPKPKTDVSEAPVVADLSVNGPDVDKKQVE
jgi:LemA protein